jgi:hypothetical protein
VIADDQQDEGGVSLTEVMDRLSRRAIPELMLVADDPQHPLHAKHRRAAARTLEQLGLRPRPGS